MFRTLSMPLPMPKDDKSVKVAKGVFVSGTNVPGYWIMSYEPDLSAWGFVPRYIPTVAPAREANGG